MEKGVEKGMLFQMGKMCGSQPFPSQTLSFGEAMAIFYIPLVSSWSAPREISTFFLQELNMSRGQ